jgi:hypothetical protein
VSDILKFQLLHKFGFDLLHLIETANMPFVAAKFGKQEIANEVFR